MVLKAPPHAEANTYGLPTGEKLRRELVRSFRAQRDLVLGSLARSAGKKDLPATWRSWDAAGWAPPDLTLGDLAMSERMVPHLEALWDDAGQDFNRRIGLDPNRWDVTNPFLQRKIQAQAFDFCAATNATTMDTLADAHAKLRDALARGLVESPDVYNVMTRMVKEVFTGAETWRARRIATTEASRAVHAADLEAAHQSDGVVVGLRWLLSDDACPLCQDLAQAAATVRLGEPFAVIGDDPTYSTIRHPPAHPHCMCSLTEVLSPRYGGPEDPRFATRPYRPTLEEAA